MKNKNFTKILVFTLLFALTGCGEKNEETTSETPEAATTVTLEENVPSKERVWVDRREWRALFKEKALLEKKAPLEGEVPLEGEALLDAFLANKIPAIYENGERADIWFSQLPHDEWDYLSDYKVGERVDLDNDCEREQIVEGPNGGIYFDARDGKVYVLAEGGGTAEYMFYTYYDNAAWIVHSDTWHGGRQRYELTKFDGKGNVVDEFVLAAYYWDSPTDWYDESSTFEYRDEEISMEEYERLREEIFKEGRATG